MLPPQLPALFCLSSPGAECARRRAAPKCFACTSASLTYACGRSPRQPTEPTRGFGAPFIRLGDDQVLLPKQLTEDRCRLGFFHSKRRRAATAVEFAAVASVAFFLILATFIGGMGVFRYQAVAAMAREAARFASTHGGDYAQENNQAILKGTLPNVTKNYIINNVVLPNAVSMDTTKLTTTISFNTSSGSYDWDDIANNGNRWPYSLKVINATTYSETNTVSVTVTYTWFPEGFLVGPITLSSKSVMPMSY